MAVDTPPEAALLDELALGTDLRAKVAQAWRDFAAALAAALGTLDPGSRLELALDPTAGTDGAGYAVTVRARPAGDLVTAGSTGGSPGLAGAGEPDDRGHAPGTPGSAGAPVGDDRSGRSGDRAVGLVAFAVGNAGLPDDHRLGRDQIADLVALGWSPPGVVPGSGGEFALTGTPAQAATIAVAMTRTLRDVYGVPHPAFVTYAVRTDDDRPCPVPPLAAARPLPDSDPQVPSDAMDSSLAQAVSVAGDDDLPLADRVAGVLAGLLHSSPERLQVDGDGDIGIRSGSAMVFVRVRDNPPLIDVFSPVLTEVSPTEQLYVKLSELTNRMPIGRLYCTDDTVWASVPVFGRDFQATHLMLAVQVMTGLADELDDRLHGEFGGRRFYGDGDKPAIGGVGERTGMYL